MPDFENMTPEQMQKMYEAMQRKENEGLTPEEIERKNREREMKKKKNIELLDEALKICQNGSYEKNGKTVSLGLTVREMTAAQVLLPEEVRSLPDGQAGEPPCAFRCENRDALSLAQEDCENPSYGAGSANGRILLLNLASAVRPGGGVRDGFGGQEEALCRASSLLLSLESDEAKPYYDYNNALHTRMGSDGVILSPDVVVFRDENGELLTEPFAISVITCSAPNLRFGLEGKSEEEYQTMLQERIDGLLRAALSFGYRDIILGAFGCGVFKNDAALVSDDFYRALTGPAGQGLLHADFAVLCPPGKEYNYNEFCRNFQSGSAWIKPEIDANNGLPRPAAAEEGR